MIAVLHCVGGSRDIEQLAEYWGELCGSSALASEWADRLITITRLAWSGVRRHVCPTGTPSRLTLGEPLFRGLPTRVIVLDDSVARQDTKGLPAFESVDQKIRPIRREHGRAIELLGQRDKRGIRKVHRQIGILVEQLPDTLQ